MAYSRPPMQLIAILQTRCRCERTIPVDGMAFPPFLELAMLPTMHEWWTLNRDRLAQPLDLEIKIQNRRFVYHEMIGPQTAIYREE